MFAALIIAAALTASQTPQAQTRPDPDGSIRLEDVVVDARRLEDAAEEFVEQVADPVGRRGMARWHEGVCVGVANLQPDVAQYVADRVSDVARDLGLRAHEPPCNPSILIVAASGGAGFTEEFVAMRPALFRPGGSGMSQGPAALEAFIQSEAPVRWWTVALKVDGDTGISATRLPGQMTGDGVDPAGASALEYAPVIDVRTVSRLNSQYRDDLKRAFVVVDVQKLGGVTLAQLGDYIAMVTLAQVDPDGDTSRFDTILNLFDDPQGVTGLTAWDKAYLEGLYKVHSSRVDQNTQIHSISDAIAREYRTGQRAVEAAAGD